ncbi:DUF624 domain-containing protein [Alkalibacillus haloalkaliphilus]|uniref:DUF624 domain-containing protein n=1 Tax=Alkalibacillus haloalkaliphilus TaxID=94136 RepID=UPI0002E501CE|nr:DUF624 domain-containing protein [Alkalibacillus haloalkaliphilus]
MNGFSLSGWIVMLSRWVARLTLTNVSWFFLNIPTWFAIYSWYLSDQKLAIIHYILFIVVFTFIFFPTTRAMFMSLRHWMMEQDEKNKQSHYFRTLFNHYKSFLKTNVLFTVIWMIWFIDIYILIDVSQLIAVVMIVIGVLLFAFQIIFFCMEAHMDMTMKDLMKYAALTTVGSPVLTVFILFVSGALSYIAIFQFTALLPFFSGVGIAYLSLLMFNHWTDSVKNKAEKRK